MLLRRPCRAGPTTRCGARVQRGQPERRQGDASECSFSVKQIIYLHIRSNAHHSRGTPGAAEHVACIAMEQCRQPEGSNQNQIAILGAGGHRRMLGTSEKGYIMSWGWYSYDMDDPDNDYCAKTDIHDDGTVHRYEGTYGDFGVGHGHAVYGSMDDYLDGSEPDWVRSSYHPSSYGRAWEER
ncbi:Uncharacterised protein [uncultured Collinsella sp.]|nr:Uncharacterised protein [uncultured Collinsella sp.]